jgi:HemY protein
MRAFAGLVVIAVLIGAGVFFADHPGRVEIVWQNWQLRTSVGVLVAAAALAALAVAIVLRLLLFVIGSPGAFLRRRRERRRHAGYRALTRGMVAVAAGDATEAQRCARRADALLAEPPLTLLLSAQAAQLDGDETAAKKFFTMMLDRPETEFLGLRGLLNQARAAGDAATALRLAERARLLQPQSRWATLSLIELETREGRWASALETLAQAARRHILPADIARHQRGVVLHELSRLAAAERDRQRALAQAAEAAPLTADLAAPVAHYARLLMEEGRTRPAARALERAWRTLPHPDLARLYRELQGEAPVVARLKAFAALAAQNPQARETHLALAEAALDAQLWGEARRHLEQALAAPLPPYATRPRRNGGSSEGLSAPAPASIAGATPRLCRLIARLEAEGRDDRQPARDWGEAATPSFPDPCWVCADCGGESLEWQSLCPHCGGFDTLSWRTPSHTVSLLPPSGLALLADAAKINGAPR